MGLKVWNVNIPVSVNVAFSIEGAATEDEAIERALAADLELKLTLHADQMVDGGRVADAWLEEWSMHKQIAEGNFYHGVINEACAELDYEEEPHGEA